MKKAAFIFTLVLAFCGSLYAQTDTVKKQSGYNLPVKVIGKDTLPVYVMEDAIIEEKLNAEELLKQKEWRRLLRDVQVVWPYVQEFSVKLKEIDDKMVALDKNRDKKKFLKEEEKRLKEEYESKLKELTFRQGKLLVKLIDRQTGRTSYQLIKDYKNGITAFFWQGFASAFDLSLKEKYDPAKEPEIEAVIHYLGFK